MTRNLRAGALILALVCCPPTSFAATKEWIGTVGQYPSNWSNGANWKDGTPPVNGDRVVFDSANLYWPVTVNDINGIVLDGIDVIGVYNLVVDGNPITLTSSTPLTVGLGLPLFRIPLTFAAPNSTIGPALINTPVQFLALGLSGGTLTIKSNTLVSFDGPVTETAPTSIFVSADVLQLEEPIAITGTLSFEGDMFRGNEMNGMAGATIAANSASVWSRSGLLATPLDLRLTGPHPEFAFFASAGLAGAPIPLDVTAPVSISGLTYFSPDVVTTFEGPISGDGRVVLEANEAVTLSSPSNAFSGGVEVQAGATLLFVNTGSLPASGALAIDSNGSANLGTYSQTANGFTCAGTFEITAGATLHSTGAVDVTGCTLQLDWPPSYVAPATITLVANASGSPVAGTFVGLPEGSTVNVNGTPRVLSYHAGAGNDIALTTPGTPHLAFDAPNYTVSEGQSISIGATYTDQSGQGTAGISVSVQAACSSGAACVSIDGPMITGSDGKATFHATANAVPGAIAISADDSNHLTHATATVTVAMPAGGGVHNVQDMWWNPSENGWGMSLIQHNDTLFGALYIYDANGNPTWVVMPGGSWDSTHTIYSGAIYQPKGSPFYAYNAPALVVGGAIGSITITFQDSNNAILDYTMNGATGRKFVTREIFANGIAAPDRSDLWWGGSAQNGWGITVLQQASTLFAVWYTYDANGKPMWYVMPGGAWTASDTYEGALYRTTSSPWVGKTYDATKLQVTNAGTFKFQFNGDNATFTYSADGHGGSMPLVREPF